MKKFIITYSNFYLGEFKKVYVCDDYKHAQTTSLNEIEHFREGLGDWFSVENIEEVTDENKIKQKLL